MNRSYKKMTQWVISFFAQSAAVILHVLAGLIGWQACLIGWQAQSGVQVLFVLKQLVLFS
jgi:hypothetical protein